MIVDKNSNQIPEIKSKYVSATPDELLAMLKLQKLVLTSRIWKSLKELKENEKNDIVLTENNDLNIEGLVKTAAEIIKREYRTGSKTEDAINSGFNYIKNNWKINGGLFPEMEILSKFDKLLDLKNLDENSITNLNSNISLDENLIKVVLEKKETKEVLKKIKMPYYIKYKKIFISIVAIIFILVVSNPTNNDFKDFLKGSFGLRFGERDNKFEYGRVNYFGVVSVFRCSINENRNRYTKSYLGIFKNFINIGF